MDGHNPIHMHNGQLSGLAQSGDVLLQEDNAARSPEAQSPPRGRDAFARDSAAAAGSDRAFNMPRIRGRDDEGVMDRLSIGFGLEPGPHLPTKKARTIPMPIFDDQGVQGPHSAKSNEKVVCFSILDPVVNDGSPTGAQVVNSGQLRSGRLVFGYHAELPVRSINPRVVRSTVHDLNQQLLADAVARVDQEATGRPYETVQAFRGPGRFTRHFQLYGAVLTCERSVVPGQLAHGGLRPGDAGFGVMVNGGLPEDGIPVGTDQRHTTIDQVVSGTVTLDNLWGNSNVQLDNGTYLWLAVRWVPYFRPAVNAGFHLKDLLNINSLQTIVEFNECMKRENMEPDAWYLQLVPVATRDDRIPFHAANSPRGQGRMIFVGTVLRNHGSGHRNIDGRLFSKYMDASFAPTSAVETSAANAESAASAVIGKLEVALFKGNQHVFTS